jgi:hypothetical protein
MEQSKGNVRRWVLLREITELTELAQILRLSNIAIPTLFIRFFCTLPSTLSEGHFSLHQQAVIVVQETKHKIYLTPLVTHVAINHPDTLMNRSVLTTRLFLRLYSALRQV